MNTRLLIAILFLPLFTRSQDSLWTNADKPGSSFTDGPYELGTSFRVSEDASISYARFYATAAGSYILHLWLPDRTLVFSQPFNAVVGWNKIELTYQQFLEPAKEYMLSVFTARAYGSRQAVFTAPITKGILTGIAGKFAQGSVSYPTQIYRNCSYYIDPLVEPIKIYAGKDDTVTLSLDTCGSVPYANKTLIASGPNGLTYEWSEQGDSAFIKTGRAVEVKYNYQGSHLYVLKAKNEAGKIVAQTDLIVTVIGNPRDVVGEVLRDGTFRTKGDAILITSPFPIER